MDQPKIRAGEGPIGLVIAPTRELATQIHEEGTYICVVKY
jgi:superfamily II DNA/RNA helicase